jgi:hypothetical protein
MHVLSLPFVLRSTLLLDRWARRAAPILFDSRLAGWSAALPDGKQFLDRPEA